MLYNTRYTGGTFHLCLREITPDSELRKLILEAADGGAKIIQAKDKGAHSIFVASLR